MERNRYADLLRVGAIGLVVIGHWLATDVTYRGGHLSGIDALSYVSWGRWLALMFQVMPVFFLVGGYANATSWAKYHSWSSWVRGRALRLLRPTTLYVVVAVLAVIGASLAGFGRGELAHVAWFVGLQLWFLPVYLLLILLTPALLGLHRRFGLAVPAVMAAGVAGVDVAMIGFHVPVVGYANYLLGWGAIHQCGFAWQDGTLTSRRWRPYALAAGGLVTLAGLLLWGPFPVDMIGVPGEVVQNANPPSIALLAFAAVQAGLLLAAEPAGQRLLASARRWRLVSRLNDTTITVYLWHFVPVVLVAVTLYRAGLIPKPGVGSWQWWAWRSVWIAVLLVVLVPLIAAVRLLERPLDRIPSGRLDAAGCWPPIVLGAGVGAAVVALIKITVEGFAPGGRLSLVILAIFAAGVVLTILSGYPPRARARAARASAGGVPGEVLARPPGPPGWRGGAPG